MYRYSFFIFGFLSLLLRNWVSMTFFYSKEQYFKSMNAVTDIAFIFIALFVLFSVENKWMKLGVEIFIACMIQDIIDKTFNNIFGYTWNDLITIVFIGLLFLWKLFDVTVRIKNLLKK